MIIKAYHFVICLRNPKKASQNERYISHQMKFLSGQLEFRPRLSRAWFTGTGSASFCLNNQMAAVAYVCTDSMMVSTCIINRMTLRRTRDSTFAFILLFYYSYYVIHKYLPI